MNKSSYGCILAQASNLPLPIPGSGLSYKSVDIDIPLPKHSKYIFKFLNFFDTQQQSIKNAEKMFSICVSLLSTLWGINHHHYELNIFS